MINGHLFSPPSISGPAISFHLAKPSHRRQRGSVDGGQKSVSLLRGEEGRWGTPSPLGLLYTGSREALATDWHINISVVANTTFRVFPFMACQSSLITIVMALPYLDYLCRFVLYLSSTSSCRFCDLSSLLWQPSSSLLKGVGSVF